MKKILMVLDNAFRPDQRVLKEIETLVSLGCKIDLYCWDHDSDLPEKEKRVGFDVTRIKIKVAKQIGVEKIKYLLKFYNQLSKKLKKEKQNYDFVYVHDFLLLPLGIFLKYRYNLKLIYDAHEIYHIMEWEKYPSYLRSFIFFTEKSLIKFTDHFIVVSQHRKNFYSQSIKKHINVVGNWFDEYKGENVNLRTKYNIPQNDIILGYFGVINFKVRPINKIVEQIQKENNIHLFIGGVGADEDQIEEFVSTKKNVYYLGWLENVREYVSSLDYVVYVMNNNRKYSAFTAPNTLYLAISHSKPIITNVRGEPLEVIKKYKVGYFIDDIDNFSISTLLSSNNKDEIIKNIEKIKNNYLWSNSKKVYKKILGIN